MQFLQLLSIVVTAIATAVIALFTYRTYQVYTSMKEIMNQSQQKMGQDQDETKDLYEAIVVATLISAPSGTGKTNVAIEVFKHYYKGRTKLFEG